MNNNLNSPLALCVTEKKLLRANGIKYKDAWQCYLDLFAWPNKAKRQGKG
jgi:hypothetical protein